MNITATDYIELPAPLESVCALLRDQATWEALPIGARRLGEFWRQGRELYTLTWEDGPPEPLGAPARQEELPRCVLRWQALPVAVPGPHAHIEIALYDGIIATHALVRVALLGPGGLWPWEWLALRLRLRAALRTCGTALQQILHTQQAALLAEHGPAGTEEDQQAPLMDRLRARYPQTVEEFAAMGALDHLERVWWLEQNWERILRGAYNPALHEVRTLDPRDAALQPGGPHRTTIDYDLIYAGGGLGLLQAAVMAQVYGWRVLLFDRSEVGCVHREWNISRVELDALVRLGLVSWEELQPVMMREYRAGVVRFHAGPASKVPYTPLWFTDVLNVALDAGGLLRLMRRKFEAAGGTVLDGHAFRGMRTVALQPPGAPDRSRISHVEVLLETLSTGQQRTYRARLLLDGMGSTSPLAMLRHAGEPFAGVCPTVGTVVSGLVPGTAPDEHDPTIGDILVSVADTQDTKQMIWEGFPGRGDELTVYVFYYAALKRAGSHRFDPHRTRAPEAAPGPNDAQATPPQPRYSLLALFEQYFALLPSYKRPGPGFYHIKPVYGYIPGRHSLHAQEAPLLRGVLPVGDSAAQQSPLTYCGFGSHVRNLQRTSSLLDYALRRDLLEPAHLRHISAYQTNVSLNWVFSRFMQPWERPQQVNELQNAFLAALNEIGLDVATRFFRDRMHWHDYNQVVWRTMRHYPDVFLIAWPVLGIGGVWQWFCDYLRFSLVAALATGARAAGPRGEEFVCRVSEDLFPAFGLQVRAHYAEWRAMGWL